jgi:hypothetical protein
MWQETKTIFLDSTAEVLRAAARTLPSVFAVLLFLLLAAVAAFIVRWLARRACERLHLDARLRAWGVAAPDAAGRLPPSRMVAGVAFWSVLVAGGFFALSAVSAPAMTRLSIELVQYVPRAVVALAILGAGLAGARYVERGVLIGAVNMGFQFARLAALAVRWLIVVFVVAVALEQARLGSGVVQLAFGTLFGGLVLAFALALGLGARDLVARSLQRLLDRDGGRDDPAPEAPAHTPTDRIQHV